MPAPNSHDWNSSPLEDSSRHHQGSEQKHGQLGQMNATTTTVVGSSTSDSHPIRLLFPAMACEIQRLEPSFLFVVLARHAPRSVCRCEVLPHVRVTYSQAGSGLGHTPPYNEILCSQKMRKGVSPTAPCSLRWTLPHDHQAKIMTPPTPPQALSGLPLNIASFPGLLACF